MNLANHFNKVLQLTAELQAAIKDEQPNACPALVARRGTAVAELGEQFAAALPDEKEDCAPLLAELKRADKTLQETGQTALGRAADDWNRSMGQAAAPRHEYDRLPDLACLDRKA